MLKIIATALCAGLFAHSASAQNMPEPKPMPKPMPPPYVGSKVVANLISVDNFTKKGAFDCPPGVVCPAVMPAVLIQATFRVPCGYAVLPLREGKEWNMKPSMRLGENISSMSYDNKVIAVKAYAQRSPRLGIEPCYGMFRYMTGTLISTSRSTFLALERDNFRIMDMHKPRFQ